MTLQPLTQQQTNPRAFTGERSVRAARDSRIRARRSGTALIVTLMIAGLLAIAVGTYLAMTSQGNTSVKRSIGWNAALPLAEAGVEEALSHVMRNTNGFGVDGWTMTNGAFQKVRILGNGFYSASVAGFPGGTIFISSTGFAAWKPSNYIARRVQVVAQTPSPFIPIGLVATNIVFGGGFGADSFDSSNPLYSTGGYYDPSKATALVTIATPGFSLSLGGSSHIRGYVATGPSGTVIMSGSSFVGDATYAGRGIQAGHQTNNFSADYPPVYPPFSSNTPQVQTPTNRTVGGVTYTYVLTGGNYFITNLDSAAYGKSIYIASNSTLYVTGNVDLDKIIFATNSAGVTNSDLSMPRLDLYVAAPAVTFAPSLILGTPPQFRVFGLPSCATMTLSSGTPFIGIIYAPQVNLRATGHSCVCGAIVAATFSCFGTFDFHFDSSAQGIAAKQFKILSWAEL
jgi:hypothetical protein